MEELEDIYNTKKQSKKPLPQVHTQASSQSLYNYNAATADKVKERKSKLNNLGKTISGLIHKTNSLISDGLLGKVKVPASFKKINTFLAANIKVASRYFGLSNSYTDEEKLKLPLKEERNTSLKLNVIDEKIIQKLRDSIRTRSVGKVLKNHKGDFLGTIKEITYDDEGRVQYVILNCTTLFGKKNRYFAIPAFSNLIKLDGEGQIVIHVDKNELKLAKGVSADRCPRLSMKFGQSVYELYNYGVSTGRKRKN